MLLSGFDFSFTHRRVVRYGRALRSSSSSGKASGEGTSRPARLGVSNALIVLRATPSAVAGAHLAGSRRKMIMGAQFEQLRIKKNLIAVALQNRLGSGC